MTKYLVLYNPYSNNKRGAEEAKSVEDTLVDASFEYIDVTKIKSFDEFFSSIDADSKVVLCGGDGTLNHFINDIDGVELKTDIYYYATGSGNDFLSDIGGKKGDAPVLITKYLKNLPTVTINGKTSKFINGIGYGIDGYCCEEGDKVRASSTKPVNYTSIAIKGLLFKFKPANGTVTVDGVKKEYKKIWLAPTMNGRYYGGGMIPTPNQDRLNPEHTLSVLVWHGSGKLPTLMAFPGIFKGEHVAKTNMCEILTGHDIVVEFDKPIAAQIDGETVLGVTKCEMHSAN